MMKQMILGCAVLAASAVLAAQKPNMIVIMTDDMGYADISPFGANPMKSSKFVANSH